MTETKTADSAPPRSRRRVLLPLLLIALVAGAFFVLAGLPLVFFLVALAGGILLLHELPDASWFLQVALIVLAIASPGLLLRGLRSLLARNYRPNRSAGQG